MHSNVIVIYGIISMFIIVKKIVSTSRNNYSYCRIVKNTAGAMAT
jgi:hypothetical protein